MCAKSLICLWTPLRIDDYNKDALTIVSINVFLLSVICLT